jgi:DNA-binding NtrC family response regulator
MTSNDNAAEVLRGTFPDAETRVVTAGEGLPGNASQGDFEYAFVDVAALRDLADGDLSADALGKFRAAMPGIRLVVMSPQAQIRDAIGVVRDGANDYLTYPIVPEEVHLVRESIERRERLSSELRYFRDRSLETEVVGSIETRADSMKAVLRKIRQVAPTRSTVLLTGETGTGKSFLAKAIHQNSNRSEHQFVAVHCGAIPDSLLESELFGHERGAFTGADRRKLGKFEIASGGTLFLDEIATISPAMQIKLLNVLQERTIQRVGGEHDIEVDVRILVASNLDLARLTEDGGFRRDLFFRLNVFPIDIPPLRDRCEDIPSFADVFVERARVLHQKDIAAIHPSVMEAFLAYEWPGNVRELENLIERACILETTDVLTPESFPEELFADPGVVRPSIDVDASLAAVRQRAADQAERLYLVQQLTVHRGRIDATAEASGITTRQLHKLMSKHHLRKEDFKSSSR